MSGSLAVAINVVLAAGIVSAVVSLLGWGIFAQRRDERGTLFVERRRGFDRRRAGGVPAHRERRRAERRVPRTVASLPAT